MGKNYEIIELDKGQAAAADIVCCDLFCCTHLFCGCGNSVCPGEFCYPNVNICYERIGEIDV